MRNLLLALIIITSGILNAQDLTKGLIMPDEGFEVCCYYIPTTGLKIYEEPNGQIVGELTLGDSDGNSEIYSAFIKIKEEKKNFGYPNLEMVGYEIMALTFKNTRSNFVQLQNGFWLSIDELNRKNLQLTSWLTYIIEKDTEWYANEYGLKLRKEPTIDSDVITTLEGDLWGIYPSTQTNGNWCKVKVIQYRKHPCSGEDNLIIQELTGWVKLVSDEQTSNVWDYGKGC